MFTHKFLKEVVVIKLALLFCAIFWIGFVVFILSVVSAISTDTTVVVITWALGCASALFLFLLRILKSINDRSDENTDQEASLED